MSRLSIVVVGAGVFGLAAALRLAQAGAEVVLHDPGASGESASGVAAGMLAPALEAVLDANSGGHFALLGYGRDLWPALLERTAEGDRLLDRSGALFLADDVADTAGRLAQLGARFERLGPGQARTLAPGLAAGNDECLFLPGEWRLEPRAALAALHAAFVRAGGRRDETRVVATNQGLALEDGRALTADRVVIAAGAEALALSEAAPELALLAPIKGQILHYQAGPSSGPVVRTRTAYVSPQPAGAIVGATMEPGLTDRRTDPAALARLRAEAERLFPALAGVGAQGRAGVRAATPDGLPLVGASAVDERLILAVGARRNGWLLAPLVAEVVTALATGADPGPHAGALSPRRFDA